MTVHLGDRRVEVEHPGHPAHMTGDLVVWLPDVRVLFVGDLQFHQVTPLAFMGSAREPFARWAGSRLSNPTT